MYSTSEPPRIWTSRGASPVLTGSLSSFIWIVGYGYVRVLSCQFEEAKNLRHRNFQRETAVVLTSESGGKRVSQYRYPGLNATLWHIFSLTTQQEKWHARRTPLLLHNARTRTFYDKGNKISSTQVSCNARLLHKSCGDKHDFIWEEQNPSHALRRLLLQSCKLPWRRRGRVPSITIGFLFILTLLFLQRYLPLIQRHVVLYV